MASISDTPLKFLLIKRKSLLSILYVRSVVRAQYTDNRERELLVEIFDIHLSLIPTFDVRRLLGRMISLLIT